MNRLRNRLILAFLAATLAPLAVTVWITSSLIQASLSYTSTRELDEVSLSLERTGREFYHRTKDALRSAAKSGTITPQHYVKTQQAAWPTEVVMFWDSGELERFVLSGEGGDRLNYLVRRNSDVLSYGQSLGPVAMHRIAEQYARARDVVDKSRSRDLRRGVLLLFIVLAAATWAVALAVLAFSTHRISRPIQRLTAALSELASGNLAVRAKASGRDGDVGRAVEAFNHMAEQLQQSRERLVFLTRLASWQALGRKMAHELKNSLTPIRLTAEEIVARRADQDPAMLEQAAQIIVDEVNRLERRVRAFSELAAEPPVRVTTVDVNALVEERVGFLKAAHPEVIYSMQLTGGHPQASADKDLLRGVLTNLLENAAEAACAGGVVLARTAMIDGRVTIEVHDSGPGLSLHARETLFEPTISFKKTGMGIGLSIARKSALLSGGDIVLVDGELGGAAFRVALKAAAPATAVEESEKTAAVAVVE